MPSIEDHIYEGECLNAARVAASWDHRELTEEEINLRWKEIFKKRKKYWEEREREKVQKARENNPLGAMIYDALLELLQEVKKLRGVL